MYFNLSFFWDTYKSMGVNLGFVSHTNIFLGHWNHAFNSQTTHTLRASNYSKDIFWGGTKVEGEKKGSFKNPKI